MRNISLTTIALTGFLVVTPTQAGSFTSDFSNPNQPGFTLNGGTTAAGNPYPVIENGHLVLTYNENSLQGTMVLNDLDPGAAVASFTAGFKMQIGQGSGNAADGFAFVFGSIDSSANFGEEGPGSLTGVTVCWDTYDNGGNEAPAIDVKINGAQIAHTSFTKEEVMSETFANVVVQLNRNGTLNVAYKDKVIYTNLVLTGWAPIAGQFGFGARTGGENENCWLDDLNVTTTVAGAPVKPIITADPQSQTVTEGLPVTFTVGYDGSAPFTFQWYSNNVAIAGATANVLTLNRAPFSANGANYKAKVTNGAGEATSNEAMLTVNADTTSPVLVSARGSLSFTTVTVVFSKAMDKTSAELISNYSFSPALGISTAVLQANLTNVTLTTARQTEKTEYTLTVSNVKDATAAGHLIPANSTAIFRAWARAQGYLTAEFFKDITGTAVQNLTDAQKYIDNQPDETQLLTAFDTPNGYGDNYGVRVTGWLVPQESGNYDFFIRSDDASKLFISMTETMPNPLAEDPVCAESGCCNAFLEPGAGQTTAVPIALQVGRKYAVIALMKEGTGGDYLQVAWRKEGDTTPAASLTPIPGDYFETYADQTGGFIEFLTAPKDTTGVDGKKATFTVVVRATSTSISYQWLKNGQTITGATRSSYTTPILQLSDSGAKYSVRVRIPGLTQTSVQATLTVVADTFPPVPSVGALVNTNGTTIDVGVGFDEDVETASASVAANYSVSPGTITSVTFYTNSQSTLLKVTGLAAGGSGTVTVKNVADRKGNKITSVNVPFTVSNALKWGVVGASELGKGNWVVPVSTNGFDVYSDSVAEWGTYDEATFVYEEITGDFDKKLRVEYQDNSSQWARAGLIVRDVTNFGVDRAAQEGGAAGRYQKCHVNPVGPTLTGPGTAGNNSWEGNRRLSTGAATTTAGGNGNPQYPNAWCRIKRKGQLFTIFRSDDAQTWVQMGTTTFPQPMPDKLYVGPEFAPENVPNITNEEDRGVFLAKFRDYGDTFPKELKIDKISITTAGKIRIEWSSGGSLQSTLTLPATTWTDVSGGSPNEQSPPPTGNIFYRLKP